MTFLRIILSILLLTVLYPLRAQSGKTPKKPKLIIGITVEGMRADYIYRYWEQFGEGGFRRLINEGTQFTNAEYDYLITQSSAGYATVATGTQPSQHGIVSDRWFERFTGSEVYCVADGKTKILGNDTEDKQEKGMSPRKMAVSTLGDQIRITTFKQSKVISIAAQDYGAVLSGGHSANAAFWFDAKTGNWVSSSYYFDKLPAWAERFNRKKLPDLYLQKDWELLQVKRKYKSSMNDDCDYEKGFGEGLKVFPYTLNLLKDIDGDYTIVQESPVGNLLTKDFAVSAIVNEDLGRDNYPDLLTVSFSANANVAKKFGIRSLEIADMYLRLDQDLAKFIAFVDDYVGLENTLIYLTADRGAADSPDFLQDMKLPHGYFKERAALSLLRSYTRALYDKGNFIQGFYANQLYLQRTVIEDAKVDLTDVQTRTADFLVNFTGVASVVTAKELETRNFSDGMLKKAQNSYYRKRSGDVFLNLAPNYQAEGEENQFSAYREFTQVPLIFFGWKIKKQTVMRPVSITDIAPSIAQILKIAPPNAASGQVLQELLPENKIR